MAFKIYPMKKKTEREKNIDHDLWEDFILKNNIKKNSNGSGVKLNIQTNKKPFVREVKEMGGIVTVFDGPSEVDKAKEIDYSNFNEF